MMLRIVYRQKRRNWQPRRNSSIGTLVLIRKMTKNQKSKSCLELRLCFRNYKKVECLSTQDFTTNCHLLMRKSCCTNRCFTIDLPSSTDWLLSKRSNLPKTSRGFEKSGRKSDRSIKKWKKSKLIHQSEGREKVKKGIYQIWTALLLQV